MSDTRMIDPGGPELARVFRDASKRMFMSDLSLVFVGAGLGIAGAVLFLNDGMLGLVDISVLAGFAAISYGALRTMHLTQSRHMEMSAVRARLDAQIERSEESLKSLEASSRTADSEHEQSSK